MLASKVTISQETRARLDNPTLTESKRHKLRQELIKDTIRRANGRRLSKQQLIAAAGLDPRTETNDYKRGMALVRSMIRKRQIIQKSGNRLGGGWKVVGDKSKQTNVNVRPTPQDMAESVMPKSVAVELQDYKVVDKLTLLNMAKEFAWKENSDSLREFINYIENAIK